MTFGLVFLAARAAPAALVNGGFESPALAPNNFQTITPGTEPVGFAWLVASGSVDIGHLPISPFIDYSAYEGNQVLDLNGLTNGTVYQVFATTPNQAYILSFAYADNSNEGGISTADIDVVDAVSLASLLSDSISHSTSTNGPPASADWTLYSQIFVATGASTRLTFTSTSASTTASGGIIIDAVAVNVPEPATWILLVVAGLSLLVARVRRR
ncbi:MAG: DUF642 domain-containing protein [Pirellulales bacterium]